MASMNLRDVPEELFRMVKATAASEGLTLRAFVLGILERDIRRGGWTPGKMVDVKTVLPVEPVPEVVSIDALREIAAGKIPEEMCGMKAFNEVDGEWYRCRLAKHSKKVRCQPGERVEG